MMEAGVVLDMRGEVIREHLPPGRSGGSLPDDRSLWDFIWENRDDVSGIAHSHPGSGTPSPSNTDITTFAAIEAALGKRLDWWIISSDSVVLVTTLPPRMSRASTAYKSIEVRMRPSWFYRLLALSGITATGTEPDEAMRQLIYWRDDCALDWSGEDLYFHVSHVLRHYDPERVPEEHRAAHAAFLKLDDDSQVSLVEATIESRQHDGVD
jgi:hypothetical protein